MALVSRLAAVCGLAFVVLASPAAAGPPGSWTQVTNFSAEGRNTDEIGLARTGDGTLHILWTEGDSKSVFNTRLSSNAQNVLGTATVFEYGGGVNNAVALLPGPGGSLRAFFSGLFADDQNHDGGMSTATSADGVTWAVKPTLASEADGSNEASPVYAAAGIGGTMFNNGTPMSIWGDSAPGASGYHVGVSPATPDVRFGGTSAGTIDPEAATDSDTGAVFIGWNDIDSGSVMVAPVQATQNPWFPPGAADIPPGSQAADLQYPVGMTGRAGGLQGVYVSYLQGTNQFDGNPAIWRVGSDSATTLTNADGTHVGVTAGPNGRLWTFWREEDDSIHARRSNTEADEWGADIKVKPPNGTDTVWSLQGEGSEGSCGALDLVALVTADTTANYHQRILPGITLKKKLLNGNEGKKAKVRFTTLDAGEPINAKVTFGGNTAETGADGKVKMKVKRKKKTRKVKARASADCFTKSQKLKIKVKKLQPQG